MTTDHTETLETSAFVKNIQANLTPLERFWAAIGYAETLEKELTKARAALATAMEERDEARKAVVISQLDLLKAKETVAELHGKWDEAIAAHSTARREKEEAESERDALRARNDALTKALEDDILTFESLATEARQQGRDMAAQVWDQHANNARRALGKEGL